MSYNTFYESVIRGNNTITGTYGNVSLLSLGKTELRGNTTISNLGIGKDSTAYKLDVNGNANISSDTVIGGNVDMGGQYLAVFPSANNPRVLGTAFDINGFLSVGTQLAYNVMANQAADTGNYFKIMSFNGSVNTDYFKAEVKSGGSGSGYLDGTINGNLIITNGTLTIAGNASTSGLTKSMVGLGNVNNTSDADKPVSTATQTALNLKAFDASCVHLSGDETITGIKSFSSPPTTSGNITLSSQLTSKAYVDLAISNATPVLPTTIAYTDVSNVFIRQNTFMTDVSINGIILSSWLDASLNRRAFDASAVHLALTETITGQKTFSQPYQDLTLTNPFMRDFSNNGFTVPGSNTRITMLGTVGAYDTTYSNWRFVSGASATRTNFVQWWYGSGGTLEWTQNQIVGSPPTSNPSVFSGNYALAFTTNAPTQSFYTQMGINLPAGYYTMTFYSYFGSSPYGGGYIGSTSAFVNISVENSTDTLNYSDPETRANGAWKLRTFNFQVVGSNATYIRWTPNETQSALYLFRWAIAGISIRKNNGNFFTDASGTTMVGGNYSFLENPVLNNPIAQNSLTCQGIPQFSLKTGASNLVLNSAFNTSNNNVNNVGIGWGLLSNTLMTNNTIVGAYSGGRSTSTNDCNIYGYRVSAMNHDTAIGSYIRCNDASYNYNGWNTVIGTYIGIENSATRQASTGVAWRCVAIGSEQFTSYNGFGKNPRSPAECISIGYRSQHKSWDNWNVSIGNFSLYNINGNNGEDDGLGYRHYTQYNVALGHEAGTFGNNYSYNTFIGARADASLNDCSFNTAVGYNAKANAFRYCSAFGSGVVNTVADSIRIGRPADTVYIDGSLNVGRDTTITGNLVVSGSTTFTSLPTCSATVSSANQLTNKSYVDSAIAGSVPSGVALIASANTFTAQNIFNGFAPQTNTDPSVANDLTRKSWIDTQLAGKQATGNYMTTDTTQSISGLKTFTSSVRMGSGGGYTAPANCLYLAQSNTYRRLIIYPVVDNEFQNYSIGANATNNEMVFMVPGLTRTFKFCNATGTTGKNDLFTLGKDFGATLSVALTVPSITLSTGLTATATQTIDFGTNAPTMSGSNITGTVGCSAIRFSGSSVQTDGGIYFPSTNLYRKLTLFPNPLGTGNNEFQNYSIGANDTNNEMMFLVPNYERSFKFGYGTSTTAKADIMTIGAGATNINIGPSVPTDEFTISSGGNKCFRVCNADKEVRISNGCDLVVSSDFIFEDPTEGNVMRLSTQDGLLLQQSSPFIMRAGTTSAGDYFTIDNVAGTIDISGVMQMNFKGDTRLNFCEPNTTKRVGGFYGAHMDLSGGRITLTNQRLSKNNLFINALNTDQNNITGGNNISGAYTIPTPYSHFYGVQGTSVFTITLPTITEQDLGNEICFRRVSGTSNISFISSGGQNAYPNGSITGQTTSFVGLTSGSNAFVAFTAMKETGNTTYAWFAHL